MRAVTWNVNSLRPRMERVLGFLQREEPDLVCLQETKCTDEQFPREPFEEAGWHLAVHGQKTYTGVALPSRADTVCAVHRVHVAVLTLLVSSGCIVESRRLLIVETADTADQRLLCPDNRLGHGLRGTRQAEIDHHVGLCDNMVQVARDQRT